MPNPQLTQASLETLATKYLFGDVSQATIETLGTKYLFGDVNQLSIEVLQAVGDVGVLVGGESSVNLSKNNIAAGGVLVGGESSVNLSKDNVAEGGVLTGGISSLNSIYNNIFEGGVVVGGDANVASPFIHFATGGVVVGGDLEFNSIYNEIELSGGVIVGGDGDSSVGSVGGGGVLVGGTANVYAIYNEPIVTGSFDDDFSYDFDTWHFSSFGVTVGGLALVPFIYGHIATGGVVVGGDINEHISHDYYFDGGVVVGGGDINEHISHDYYFDGGVVVGGEAVVTFTLHADLEIEWQTRATIEIEKEFIWNTGLLPLRWYRVQGCCVYPTLAGDGMDGGQPGGCNVIGIQTDDEKCIGKSGKQQFIQNLVGSSVSDICRQLTESRLNWEICSIKQWSRSADNSQVSFDDQCNTLTEVPYCEIPECINFCVNTNAYTIIGVTTYVIESINSYEGSGVVFTGGEARTRIVGVSNYPNRSYFKYISEGGEVLTGGEAITSSSWDSDLLTTIGATTYVENLEAVFSIEGNGPQLELPTQVIGTSCGFCDAMPLVLYMFHNLSNENILVNYMQRNGLELPNPLFMHYSARLKSWVANFHMTGTSSDNLDSTESWRFSFEWSCINSYGGDDLGSPSWKFSMLVVRKNELNNVDFDTRVLIIFPAEQICLTSENLGFDFSFNLNTITKFVLNDSDIVPSVTLLADNIGLFKSKFWAKTPNFTIRLSKGNILSAVQRQDIYPIFPRLVDEDAITPFITR